MQWLRVKRIVLTSVFVFSTYLLSAQLTLGTTGLLNSPSAEMQPEGTVMLGGNFLNDHITRGSFPYDTYNYFLNITFLPFLEVAYTCTLFKATDTFVPWKKGRFVNQDRSFSVRLRLLQEREKLPAIVIGSNDVYTQSGGGEILSEGDGNQYFSRFWVAMMKHVPVTAKERVGLHLAYLYNRRASSHLNGFSGGINYKPSFAPDLNLIVQYDSKSVCVGANYLLWNHLFLQALLQDGKHFSGGLAYKIYLKRK